MCRSTRREPGLDFQDYAQRELFDQLGIPKSAYFWQRDRVGTTTAYSQLWLRPWETGRLGELIRTGGIYDHRRIISERYMRELRTASKTNCSYGFFTFLNSCRPGEKQVDVSVPTRRDPDRVRASIANSGPYDRSSEVGLDLTHFLYPLNASVGTYLSLGPGAPEGRNPLGCEDEPNDGLRWILDIPRIVPGILGLDARPNGH